MTIKSVQWKHVPVLMLPWGYSIKVTFVKGRPRYRLMRSYVALGDFHSVTSARLKAGELAAEEKKRNVRHNATTEDAEASDGLEARSDSEQSAIVIYIAHVDGGLRILVLPENEGFNPDARWKNTLNLRDRSDAAMKVATLLEQHLDDIEEISSLGGGLACILGQTEIYRFVSQDGVVSGESFASIDDLLVHFQEPSPDAGLKI